MKRFILIMFFVVIFTPLAFSGDPLLLKGVKTTLGASDARPFGIYEFFSYTFTYGYTSNLGDSYKQSGFLACFDSTLTLKWVFADSSSDRPYIASAIPLSNGGTIAALLDGWKSGTTLLFMDETGMLTKKIKLNGTVSLGKNENKMIAITAGQNGTVYIMSENGIVLNQWNTTYENGPKVKIQVLDNSLWLSSFSNVGTYVAKHNFSTGELLWHRIVPNGFLGYSDLDSTGNSYFGSTQLVPNSGAPGFNTASQWHLEKLDPDGNIVWKNEWFSRETWVGRVNAAISTISINSTKNLVVIGGDIQKEETIADGSRASYLAGFSMDSGKIAWEKKWSYSDAYVSTVYGTCFDTEGDMFVAGYEYNGPPPAYLNIEKYSIGSLVGIDEETGSSIPESFSLSQNYPNPFNPSTTINYSIPKSANVTITVINSLGQEVKTLVNEYKPAGNYSTEFNAANLSSGIYFCSIRAGDFIETKKMILMK
jgi:hypothetical protein